jgi:hypothetical protein
METAVSFVDFFNDFLFLSRLQSVASGTKMTVEALGQPISCLFTASIPDRVTLSSQDCRFEFYGAL